MESYTYPHEYIFHDLESGILSGRLMPGCRIPSIRTLAMQYQVNPNTVQRAAKKLELEGLFVSHRGNGIMITEDLDKIRSLRQERADEITCSFIQKMAALGYSYEQVKNILSATLKRRMNSGNKMEFCSK